MDDVGWADFNYNVEGSSSIPTPNLDRLAGEGLKLKSHYVHPTCTPSRAALLTGRYAANTGLPFATFPGSVAGLPDNMATMPRLLRQSGYSAHMVGKWHLGHAQWKQGPVGRGFESHTGSFMWDLESYTKLMWRTPFTIMGADWGKSYENGSYAHMAEPRHATIAITDEAITRMEEHDPSKPLFLYVSYNAAHSPLQPEPAWEAECGHIPHLWRRQFCGMVVGLDQAIERVVSGARDILGENTVVVVTPDNGGSTWFGGLNAPLRSGKLTPFEGGVRVPAFAVDLSGNYMVKGGKEFNHMFHISDWLPTFLSWAGSTKLVADLNLDGKDQSKALLANAAARNDVLLELYRAEDSHDGSESAAYRKGKYKLIQGNIRDPYWYSEPTEDRVATNDDSYIPRMLEGFVRFLENIFGPGPCDVPHIVALNLVLSSIYNRAEGYKTLLFDLEADPEEKTDISDSHPDVVKDLLEEIAKIKKNLPYHPRYWMVNSDWTKSFIPGDCSGQTVLRPDQCRFAHHWVDDSVDITNEEGLGLENAVDAQKREGIVIAGVFWLVIVLSIYCACFRAGGEKTKLKNN